MGEVHFKVEIENALACLPAVAGLPTVNSSVYICHIHEHESERKC